MVSHEHLASGHLSDGDPRDKKDVEGSDEKEKVLTPSSHLPQPEAPPGLLLKSVSDGGGDYAPRIDRSLSQNSSPDVSTSIGKFLRERGTALAKTISSLKESPPSSPRGAPHSSDVTEFHLSGVRVVVKMKSSELGSELKGRISFFSRSNCRDCTAVRSFFREKGLKYVEINLDVFPEREMELVERTGCAASVPQIFLNDKLLGGLVALNSLRNCGELEKRLRGMAGGKCPDTAPRVPAYGFDDDGGRKGRQEDELVAVVRFLRRRLPIQDRITRMKLVKNCFSAADLVEAVIHHLDCGRRKAVQIGEELARKHFIHHVFRETGFEDGNQLYRFLEHDPMIPKCFNFRAAVIDDEPKPVADVGRRLTKLMFAILEAYASDDGQHLDYRCISVSEEFRRYVNLVQDLQRVDIYSLSTEKKLAFFMNLYNAMVIHAVIRIGRPDGVRNRSFFNDFCYIIGGYSYSLSTIKNGILRSNQRQPYSFVKPFSSRDKRLELALPKVNPLIHFGLCNGTRSSPRFRFFSAEGIEIELRQAAREFFQQGGMQINLEKRTVYLTSVIKWYSVDFVQDKEILKWIINFLDANKAGLLTHLLSDGSPINIVYQDFDGSLNT